MSRLTTNKDVKEMGMYELALNCCYYKNTNARYRDFNKDFDARDLVRQLMVAYGKWKSISQNGLDANNELIDDEIFDDTMLENLMCPPTDLEGLIALFYRNIHAMAELREELKVYEDAEEQGLLLKLPFGIDTPIYKVCYAPQINDGFIYETTMSLKFFAANISAFEEGLMYSDKDKAEQALQRMKEGV